jgi:sugar lactone lactonase YvrE
MLRFVILAIAACSVLSVSFVPDPTWVPTLPAGLTSGKVSSLAVDRQSTVFVGQRGTGAPPVMVFAYNGTYLRGFGSEIKGFHGLKVQPMTGTSKNDALWVTDTKDHDVKKYDSVTGKLLLRIGTTGTAGNGTDPIQFGSVADIAFDSSGNIYISDGDGGVNNRVMKLSGDTHAVQWIAGNGGEVKEQFSSPHSIAYDEDTDSVYVADRNNFRIVVLQGKTGVTKSTLAQDCFPGATADNATAWGVRIDGARNILYVAIAHSAVTPASPTQARIVAFDISKKDDAACPKVLQSFDVGQKPQAGASCQWTLHELANDVQAYGAIYGATVDAPWEQATVRFVTKL